MKSQASCFALFVWLGALPAEAAWAQNVEGRVSALEAKTHRLETLIGSLRTDFSRLIVIGRVVQCDDSSFWPASRIEKVSCERPGLFTLTLKQKNLKAAPIVFVAPLNTSGNVPIEKPGAHVVEVTPSRFTVKTTNGDDTRNVAFSFAVFAVEQ